MDHSTAVLDEAYGTLSELGLTQLNLATRRVYSNLQSPAFRDSLPYVPKRTGFTADPDLLTLLVEPLYGKKPAVGVRELMQNAVDAVCELDAWCSAHGIAVESLDLPEQDGDVLIEFIKRKTGTWFLRVRDRGIGMKSDTIQNYFLRAGASFRRSAEWTKEFLDEKGQARVIRAGRFGVGAFAVFLLGPSFRLCTRYIDSEKSMGYRIEASANSRLIEVRRVDELPVGTTIEVEVSSEAVKKLELDKVYSDSEGPARKIDWFCWEYPKIVKRVIRGSTVELLNQEYLCPVRKSKLPPEWSVIHPDGFDAVYWPFGEIPRLSCNGLEITDSPLNYDSQDYHFDWPEYVQLDAPCISVLDSAANLPLTTQRYGLMKKDLPFIDELTRDVTLSFIAYVLVCGPTSQKMASISPRNHPLANRNSHYGIGLLLEGTPFFDGHPFAEGRLRLCTTSVDMVPLDKWLYSILEIQSCGSFSIWVGKEVMKDNWIVNYNRVLIANGKHF